MADQIYTDYLAQQLPEILALAEQSDLLSVEPGPALPERLGGAPDRYVLHFHGKGLVAHGPGDVRPYDHFVAGVWLHPMFVRQAEPFPTLTLIHPHNTFHPNVQYPAICLQLRPAMSLVSIAYALYALFTFQNFQLLHGLNADAADYVRRRRADGGFPTDRRPLKWRATAEAVKAEGGAR